MHFTSFTSLFTMAVLASSAAARIVSISAPATTTHGGSLKVTVQTQDYVSDWEDWSIIWGYEPFCATCVGTPVASTDLHTSGHYNTGTGSFTEIIPAPTSAGNYSLVAAITSIYGAADEASVSFQTTHVLAK